MQGGLSPLADQEVTVINARVVQKSYGTEKRCVGGLWTSTHTHTHSHSHSLICDIPDPSSPSFFCPPPCISFSGHGWDRPELGTMHVFVGLDNNPDEFQEVRFVLQRCLEEVCVCVCVCSVVARHFPTAAVFCRLFDPAQIEPENGVCTARSLYISDQDKRKSFSLRVKVWRMWAVGPPMPWSRLVLSAHSSAAPVRRSSIRVATILAPSPPGPSR